MADPTDKPGDVFVYEKEEQEKWLESTIKTLGKRLHGFLKEAVHNKLDSLGYFYQQFDDKHIDRVMKSHWANLWRKYSRDNFPYDFPKVEVLENRFKRWDGLEKALILYLDSICTELTLSPYRNNLSDWVDKVEIGKALFVDAPMGLGKTHSIVEALVKNDNLSAVIFMPTNRLCQEVYLKLKQSIAFTKGLEDWLDIVEQENIHYLRYATREYLKDEVYWADGINETDCPHYADFIKRYKDNWINKADICSRCNKKNTCRFRKHMEKAPESRIVVTTHRQYDNWYKNSNIRKWFQSGIENIEDAVERDFFIVDEDLVLSQCYQPTSLTPKETKDFVATITSFLEQYDNTGDTREKINSLLGKITQCDKTALIRPIDPDFKFPSKIKNDWQKSLPEQEDIIPETLDWSERVGNHLELVESALRFGFVVQKYNQQGKDKEEQIYRVYFPNSKTYDLSRLPPHVFFDGTMLEEKFLGKKLLNVEFEKHLISVKPIWQIRVWQNLNSDLPRRRMTEDEPRTKAFVRQVLNDTTGNKYLFITTKATKEAYLESFLRDEYPNLDYVIMYYGNLKGINDAKDCDVCIVLGSFQLSDALEITMALEFLQEVLPDQDITLIEGNLWSWKGSMGQRVYRDKYAVVDELTKALRLSEQRQALARTRYLSHDVDFYVVSKDLVSDNDTEKGYDPFLPKAESEQYLSTIFTPRKKRSDSKKDEVRSAIVEYLKEHETATDTAISEKYGFSRTTIRPVRLDMLEEDILEKVGKIKYKLAQTESETEQGNLIEEE